MKKTIETIIWIFLGIALFGNLLIIAYLVIHIGFYLTARPQAEMKSPLQTVWETRVDLQAKFPDGVNGVEEMQGWTLQQWAQTFGWKENRLLKRYNPEAEKEYIYQKYLPLERALRDIADSNIYDRENYNCVNFTEDLQARLDELDIATVMINGKTPHDRPGKCHRWIAVQIESITGEFVKISDGYVPRKFIKKRKEKIMKK